MQSDIIFYKGVHFAYHLTLNSNISGIIKKGLIPQCGPNCKRVDDDSVGIHFTPYLEDIYDFWIDALYDKKDKELLKILRFNLQNKNIQRLCPATYHLPGDWIVLNKVNPSRIEYLVNPDDEGITYDEEKQLWLPIKQYQLHK